MCFSPTASFSTAAFTGAVGLVAILRARQARELPLAVVPLLFAFQQAVEGGVWLVLPTAPHGAWAANLTLTYLLFAQVFWPVYAPAAAWVLEPDRVRRGLMLACLGVGVIVALNLFIGLLTTRQDAEIVNRCIVYGTPALHPLQIGLPYLAATTLPLLLSTRRTILTLGAVIMVGSVIAYLFYWQAFQSVWCFFAAAGSVVILAHFEHARRWGPPLAAQGQAVV